jgi:hypothetical protein
VIGNLYLNGRTSVFGALQATATIESRQSESLDRSWNILGTTDLPRALQAGGHRFDPGHVHQFLPDSLDVVLRFSNSFILSEHPTYILLFTLIERRYGSHARAAPQYP